MNHNIPPFDGELLWPNGLSNESLLVINCPQEFFSTDNPWSSVARSYIRDGRSDMRDWKWKTTDIHVRTHQAIRLEEIIAGSSLDEEYRQAIAGWMLSEMLREVPAVAKEKLVRA